MGHPTCEQNVILKETSPRHYHGRPVSCTQHLLFHIDNTRRLPDRSTMDHGLIAFLDRRRMIQHQHLSFEPSGRLGTRLILVVAQQHHPFPDRISPDVLQRKRHALACLGGRDRDAFAVDALDDRRIEHAGVVRSNQDPVAHMDQPALHDPTHHGAHKRYRIRLVDLVVERLVGVVFHLGRQHVQETAQKIEPLACHIADLKDRTETLTHKVLLPPREISVRNIGWGHACSIAAYRCQNNIVVVLDKERDLAARLGFQDGR